jgi:hypothetical protein
MFNICVAFNCGSYGTFIEWCLNYFSNKDFPQKLPFINNGSSHNYAGNQLVTFDNLKAFVENPTSDRNSIVRFHPKVFEDERIIDNMRFVAEHFNKVIFLHPTKNSMIWNINNKFDKNFDEDWLLFNKEQILENLSHWEVSSLDGIEIWKLREFLSLYIYDQHIAESGLNLLNDLKTEFKNILFVPLEDLRDKFKQTINTLFDYSELNLINQDKIEVIFDNWINCQYHKNKDNLVNKITTAIVDNVDLSWSNENLSIIDESFIQMKLYNKGIKIKCFNLNKFPTSTNELKPFLYAS